MRAPRRPADRYRDIIVRSLTDVACVDRVDMHPFSPNLGYEVLVVTLWSAMRRKQGAIPKTESRVVHAEAPYDHRGINNAAQNSIRS